MFGASGDHERAIAIVTAAMNAAVDRSREEWGDGYYPRQQCDEEWLDAQLESAYRAGWYRALIVGDSASSGSGFDRQVRLLLAGVSRDGPNPTDMRLDLERAAGERA